MGLGNKQKAELPEAPKPIEEESLQDQNQEENLQDQEEIVESKVEDNTLTELELVLDLRNQARRLHEIEAQLKRKITEKKDFRVGGLKTTCDMLIEAETIQYNLIALKKQLETYGYSEEDMTETINDAVDLAKGYDYYFK